MRNRSKKLTYKLYFDVFCMDINTVKNAKEISSVKNSRVSFFYLFYVLRIRYSLICSHIGCNKPYKMHMRLHTKKPEQFAVRRSQPTIPTKCVWLRDDSRLLLR